MISLRECLNQLRWHCSRMLSKTPQLIIVETINEYTSTTSGEESFTHLSYTTYYNLLIHACVRYDMTNTSIASKIRNVYTAAGAQDLTNI